MSFFIHPIQFGGQTPLRVILCLGKCLSRIFSFLRGGDRVTNFDCWLSISPSKSKEDYFFNGITN